MKTSIPSIAKQVLLGTLFALQPLVAGAAVNLGNVQVSTLGHSFINPNAPFPPPGPQMPGAVSDYLIDHDQSSGGGGALPNISVNWDTNSQFVLTVSAPPGQKFLVHVPPGRAAQFGGLLLLESTRGGNSPVGPVAVSFAGLEGTAPDFTGSDAVLSDSHGYFGFWEVTSSSFSKLDAQIISIDFENIPPTYTPVDSFGALLPGVALTSGNQWIADEVCNSCFEHLHGRAITAFPNGAAPLSIGFAEPVENVTMDFGSSQLGLTLSVGVTGYRANQLIFSNSFVTHPVPGGADEVRAQSTGLVDRVVIARTAGAAHLILDNLSFAVAAEHDSDGDGVPDSRDLCPDSPANAVVDADGCSIDQLAPCDGPWKNHGEYVRSVAEQVSRFLSSGLITEAQGKAFMTSAAQSPCGKRTNAKP